MAARSAVRDLLAASSTDVTVRLLGGRHRVPPGGLALGARDGGQSPAQRVVWRSDDGRSPATVDGGVALPGPWTPSGKVKGALRAAVPPQLLARLGGAGAAGESPTANTAATLRQLWVGGRRAQRPVLYAVNQDGTGPLPGPPCCAQPCRNREPPYYPCPGCNCSVTNTTDGYDFSANHVDPSEWENVGDVEFVFHFPGEWTPWIEPRCTVDSVAGKVVKLKQPCFGDLAQRNLGPTKQQMRPMVPPAWIENTLANFSTPGTWYFDRQDASILYIPRSGEDPETIAASAYTSVEETILLVNGTRNLEWSGVAFEHATWFVPNSRRGFVDWQAGYSGGYGTFPGYEDCHDGRSCSAMADANGCGSTTQPADHCEINRGTEPPGNVRVLAARNVSFSGCRFEHLGGIYAISASFGSQHVAITNSTFSDVSGGAVHIGSTGSRWTTGPKMNGSTYPPATAPVAVANDADSGGNTPPRDSLVAAPCKPGKKSQLWTLSPGVHPGGADATLVQMAADTTDRGCWRVIACLSVEGAAVAAGRGCTPVPKPSGGKTDCGKHNCSCNGAFIFHKNDTITSLMDGHCLGSVGEHAGSAVSMATCTGDPSQTWITTPSGTGNTYTISQDEGVLCIEAPSAQPAPPPGPPPPHPPPSPHPPPPQPQPVVPVEDWDRFFVVRDNHIADIPQEFHGAVGIFGGYIANSTIAHNTLERLSYTAISVGWG